MYTNLRFDRILWVGFLLVIGLLLYAAIGRKKDSFAEGVDVVVIPLKSGDKLISERDVRQALLRSFGNTLEGTELANLEVERMERVLEEDPFVLDAEAYIDQHNVFHVKIHQREPVLRVLDNNGGNYYLDKEGIKMPPSPNFAARVIVATGNVAPYMVDFKKHKKRSTLKDLFSLTETLLADEFLAGFIQQIHISNTGEFTLIPLIGDQKIILGSARKVEDKLRRLKIFYQQGMPYTGWRTYESINLSFSGQVVCKR